MQIRKMIFVVLLSLCLLLSMTSMAEGSVLAMPNPMRETTAQIMMEEMGISFSVPDDAEGVTYAIINSGKAGIGDIAQVSFRLDEEEYVCRKQVSGLFSDISGMYYDWTLVKDVPLSNALSQLCLSAEGQGALLWYNQVFGMACSVSMGFGATEEKLIAVAEPISADMTQEAEGLPPWAQLVVADDGLYYFKTLTL